MSLTAPKSRSIRVFISSTFSDMQEERNLLVNRVFPVLWEKCRACGVDLVEIDLRWGISDTQVQEGLVLPICLAEIEHCRPFFIGILGERYGFVPERLEGLVLESYPWLAAQAGRSVTELEILHGALHNREAAERSFFYFRAAEYTPEGVMADLPESQRKLATLKQQIRQSGVKLRENYAEPAVFAEWLESDLWEAIDAAFPAESEESPEALEDRRHA